MNVFEITAESRADQGKGASRRLRHAGKVPAILYGGDKAPETLTLEHSQVLRHLEHEAFYSHLLTLNIGERKEKVVLKDLQRHPGKPIIMHMDFQRVDPSRKLHMHIPLHFTNEDKCVGVKIGGGSISHQMVEVEVTCMPKDLPEYIEVDMAEIEAGQVLHLTNLKLPEGVELSALAHGDVEEHDSPVVIVHKGRGSGDEIEEGASLEE